MKNFNFDVKLFNFPGNFLFKVNTSANDSWLLLFLLLFLGAGSE